MHKKLVIIFIFFFFSPIQKNQAPGANPVQPVNSYSSGFDVEDFIVNDDDSGHYQSNPGITIGGNGHFYIVWDDNRNGYTDIFCQAYNNNGNPLGGNFKVNETHSAHHQFPDIASDSLGNFIIAWIDARDGTFHIYGQNYQSNGSAVGENFQVSNDMGQNSEGNANVAMNKKGDFVVVWENSYQNAIHVYGQRYSNNVIPKGVNFQVNDNTVSTHIFSDVAIDNYGNFVVVWEEEREGQYDIYAQRFDANGNQLWGNFKVNDEINSTHQMHPAVGMDAEGNFVIAWNDWRDGAINIYGQQFDHNGVKINSNFRVNDEAGANGITYPDIARGENGSFMVAWPHNITGIYGQLFDSAGDKSGVNFRIDSGPENTRQLLPCVAIQDDQIYSAWQDNRLESQGDIFANILEMDVLIIDTVATPVFDPLPGIYTYAVDVSISCPTVGAAVYYTTDGSDPSESSNTYAGPVHIPVPTTLKAKAYKEGLIPSEINTGTYTIEQEPIPVETDSGLTLIQLHQGWNLFSFDVVPADLRIVEILNGIAGDYDLVAGFDEGIDVTYDPDSSETSTLQFFDPLHGYYIHMLNPAVLTVSGNEILVQTPIILTEGIHLISYLPDDPLPVEEALQSILDHLVYVKSIDRNGLLKGQRADEGLSYDPALSEFSTLLTMRNGFGYWVQVDTTVTLTYPGPGDTDNILLASAVIGPGGGTLSDDNFILTVPQNAFESDISLSLYDVSEEFSDDDVNSMVFGLAGLPDDYALPLRLCVKYTGDLSDEHFISVGEEVFIPDLLDTEYLHFYYTAEDSSDFLVATLPAGNGGTTKSKDNPSSLSKKWFGLGTVLKVVNAVKGRRTHQSKYFTIAYPFFSSYASRITEIGNYFDDVVKTGIGRTGMGFGVSQLALLEKKLFHVIIEDDKSNLGYYLKTKPYRSLIANITQNYDKFSMHLNESTLAESEDILRQKAGILVFGLRQWMRFNDQDKWNWLHYAYELWIGGKFALDPSSYNPFALSNAGNSQLLIHSSFNGIEAGWQYPEGVKVNSYAKTLLKKQHGHGMTVLLKYIEDTYKIDKVTKIWDTYSSSKKPVDVIMEILPAQEYEWWPSFLLHYVSGDIYNLDAQILLKTIKNENIFFIDDASDEVKDFDRTYADFSAELFRVVLDHDQIHNIVFTLGPPTLNLDYQTFFVYKLKNNILQYIDQGVQSEQNIQLTVENIPTLMQSGYTSLVALVVNSANESPYTGSVNIEFEVKCQKMLRQSWITFDNFTYDGNTVDPWSNVLTRTGQPLEYTLYSPLTGEYSDKVYEVYWENKNDSWSTGDSDGYMRIEFNFNNQIITFFHFEVVSKGGMSTKELTLEAVDIPYRGKDYYLTDWDLYKIVGKVIKTDHITQFNYVQTDHMSSGDWVTTLTDFHTQSNSYIYVFLK